MDEILDDIERSARADFWGTVAVVLFGIIFSFSLVYLVGSFTAANFDVTAWTLGSRWAAIIAATIVSVFVTIGLCGFWSIRLQNAATERRQVAEQLMEQKLNAGKMNIASRSNNGGARPRRIDVN